MSYDCKESEYLIQLETSDRLDFRLNFYFEKDYFADESIVEINSSLEELAGRELNKADYEVLYSAMMCVCGNVFDWLDNYFVGVPSDKIDISFDYFDLCADTGCSGSVLFDSSSKEQKELIKKHHERLGNSDKLIYNESFYKGFDFYLPTGEKVPELPVYLTFEVSQ